MIAHSLLVALLVGFLKQTQVASHITRRVVDSFGTDGKDNFTREPVVVAIDQASFAMHNSAPVIDPADWLVIPPPTRFVMLSDNLHEICLMGVVLDAISGQSPAISWIRIGWDSPVSISLPSNSLGAFFGIVDPVTRSLTIRRIYSFNKVEGYSVLALRDASENPYTGVGRR